MYLLPKHVILNSEGQIDTWAIFWYATIFKHNGLCVNPYFSHAKNIGFDGSGVHCTEDKKIQDSQMLNHHGGFIPQIALEENKEALSILKSGYRNKPKKKFRKLKSLIRKILNQDAG